MNRSLSCSKGDRKQNMVLGFISSLADANGLSTCLSIQFKESGKRMRMFPFFANFFNFKNSFFFYHQLLKIHKRKN